MPAILFLDKDEYNDSLILPDFQEANDANQEGRLIGKVRFYR